MICMQALSCISIRVVFVSGCVGQTERDTGARERRHRHEKVHVQAWASGMDGQMDGWIGWMADQIRIRATMYIQYRVEQSGVELAGRWVGRYSFFSIIILIECESADGPFEVSRQYPIILLFIIYYYNNESDQIDRFFLQNAQIHLLCTYMQTCTRSTRTASANTNRSNPAPIRPIQG